MNYNETSHRKDIINLGDRLIEDMTQRHNKVLPVRLDFRFPSGYPHDGRNTDIQHLHKRLIQHYRYHGVEMRYLTVREQNASPVPHYHTMLLIDGNKHQSPYSIQETAAQIWREIVGSRSRGLTHFCQHTTGQTIPPLEMIRRPSSVASEEQREQQSQRFERACQIVRQHGSYLAKNATKGSAPGGVREVMSSQVR